MHPDIVSHLATGLLSANTLGCLVRSGCYIGSFISYLAYSTAFSEAIKTNKNIHLMTGWPGAVRHFPSWLCDGSGLPRRHAGACRGSGPAHCHPAINPGPCHQPALPPIARYPPWAGQGVYTVPGPFGTVMDAFGRVEQRDSNGAIFRTIRSVFVPLGPSQGMSWQLVQASIGVPGFLAA